MKIFRKILWALFYALPAVLFFSYHPVISLGANASMNFELSLPLLWLVIFDVLSFVYLIMLWRQRKGEQRQFAGISDRRFFLLALFPLYTTLSVLWSDNPLRGLLTAGVMWLVFFAVFAIIFVLPQGEMPRRLRTHTLLVMFVAAVVVCKFCYAQSIMDVLGVSRDTTLLCLGCTYRSFGFPHPSGFAIEPQFMGNLLLAPTLTALYMVVFRPRKFAKSVISEAKHLEAKAEQKLKVKLPEPNWQLWQYIGMVILAGFLSMTLFFTFSRGAIYAYGVAIVVLLGYALKRRQFSWQIITIPVVSFVLALGLQGTLAAVGPTAETFTTAVTKSIHQLSLGIIDLRELASNTKQIEESLKQADCPVQNSSQDCGKVVENSAESVDKSSENVEKDTQNGGKPANNSSNTVQNSLPNVDNSATSSGKPVEKLAEIVDKTVENHEEKSEKEAEKAAEDAIFEGYVSESTNIRLALNDTAIKTWLKSPLFGVGLGGAGVAMHAAHPEAVTSPKEIVQNQGFSLLLETGIIGVALAVLGLFVALWPGIFPAKFLDGKAAKQQGKQAAIATVWQHPARPLLLALVVAYLITLNFFSGLPNALQIYLMPPVLYLIFQDPAPKPKINRK